MDKYYDTNPFDAAYTQNGAGRVTAVAYQLKRHTGTQTFTWLPVREEYSYTADGRPLKKRLTINGI